MSLLQMVRLIHSVSQFYNTSERTSSLMVKVWENITYFITLKSYLDTVKMLWEFCYVFMRSKQISGDLFYTDHKSDDWDMQAVHNLSRKGDNLVTGSFGGAEEITTLHQTQQDIPQHLHTSQKSAISSWADIFWLLWELCLWKVWHFLWPP